ncbi:MAG: type IV secretion protein Rhs [Candidatus Thiodiazotropha sp. (ex Dulcina madagascariensis)]|nr:type IV secretion protein Rhs [Candidatus Thiodiazotropha sp. (ex Dulcina madagascariensis)]MCU7925861.1 type IV secretion protein Rhs [Candidatus Thiodiazotropha sp. (ex Dulcina madagascariensis)]
MQDVTQTAGLPNTDYYAPNFRVEIEGEELDREAHGDILELKVVMDKDNMTSFDFTVNNWDDKTIAFKYSDRNTFDVGKHVHIMMGYADRMLSMVSGQIATMTPRFVDGQASTLTVSGQDGMALLRDSQPGDGETIQYLQKADWEIAQAIAERHGLNFEATREGEVHTEVIQRNQDDAQFLMERAKRIDFDCFIITDPESNESTLNFVRPPDGRTAGPIRTYQFVWGESLISFTPTISLSRQVSTVTVRGWDDRTKQAIVATATADDLPETGSGSSGPQVVADTMPRRQEVVVDSPVASYEEARDLAISILRERAYEFITGVGRCIGLADLRCGDNIELQRLGRFSGTYYVKKVSHSIGGNGYLTDFEARRLFHPDQAQQGGA